jgi:pimeloyl-ACP methyl ester carboxylesterase
MAQTPILRHLGLLAALALLATAPTRADEPEPLPRRGWLGVMLEPVTPASQDGTTPAQGVKVRGVLPGGSAEAGGLKAGDVIRTVEGAEATSVPELVRRLKTIPGGQTLKVDVVREGTPASLSFAMKPWPKEEGTDAYAVEYGSAPSAGGRLRTITFVPRPSAEPGTRRPALLMIQGLGMATLDNPRPDEPVDEPTGMNVYRRIAAALADRGFVVTRVDKAGCGDSEGDPDALDFDAELDGYRQALARLKGRDDVDPDRVFLFGHSMGGVFAPILAGETPVRGVAVAGTVIKSWLEYVLENERRQLILADTDWPEIDRKLKLSERFHHALLVEGRSPSEIAKADPELAGAFADMDGEGGLIFGRPYTFYQKLQTLNLPELWSKAHGDALALWGEAEFVSTREDHEWIAAIVQGAREGADTRAAGHEAGTFAIVPNSTHGFDFATSARAAATGEAPPPGRRAGFTPEILTILASWLESRS